MQISVRTSATHVIIDAVHDDHVVYAHEIMTPEEAIQEGLYLIALAEEIISQAAKILSLKVVDK